MNEKVSAPLRTEVWITSTISMGLGSIVSFEASSVKLTIILPVDSVRLAMRLEEMLKRWPIAIRMDEDTVSINKVSGYISIHKYAELERF